MAPEIGGRVARRHDDRQRRRIVVRTVAAGVGVIAIVVVGIVLLTRSDDPATKSASNTHGTTTSSAASSTTTSSTVPVPTTVVPRSSNPVVALAQQYDGYYEGTWTNQTFNQSGPAVLEIRIDPNANTLRSKASFNGDLFGGGTGTARSIDSTINIGDPTAAVTVQTDAFGTVTARIDASLALILDAPDVPGSKVRAVSLTGRLNASRNGFDSTYSVTFEDGSTAQGVMNVVCAPNNQRPSDVQTLCSA
jgi:hypothetical protein